jgi:hypothetical protein
VAPAKQAPQPAFGTHLREAKQVFQDIFRPATMSEVLPQNFSGLAYTSLTPTTANSYNAAVITSKLSQ